MISKLIEIRVIKTSERGESEPWKMTIADSNEIKAYMLRGNNLHFNYKGDIYAAYDISEREFLGLCPHLNKQLQNS